MQLPRKLQDRRSMNRYKNQNHLIIKVDRSRPVEITQAWKVHTKARKAPIYIQQTCHINQNNKTAGQVVKEYFYRQTI